MVYSSKIKKVKGLDVDVGFQLNYVSVGYSIQCLLVWSSVEE